MTAISLALALAVGEPSESCEAHNCGRDSLFLLLRLMGRDATFDEVHAKLSARPSSGGVTIKELCDAAQALSCPLAPRKVSLSDAAQFGRAFIAYQETPSDRESPGHFFVIVPPKSGAPEWTVLNAERAPRQLSAGEVGAMWSGGVALLPLQGGKPILTVVESIALASITALGLSLFYFGIRRQRRALTT